MPDYDNQPELKTNYLIMKSIPPVLPVISCVFLAMTGCAELTEDDPFKIETLTADTITSSSAWITGSWERVDSSEIYIIDRKGFYVGLTPDPQKSGTQVFQYSYEGSPSGLILEKLTNLKPGTTHYFQAFINSKANNFFGDVKSFKTLAEGTSGTFMDKRDGHEYKWIRIGTQTWMAENLAFLSTYQSKPQEGSEIFVHSYIYGDDGTGSGIGNANQKIYGVLYNWPAASSACPEGWHLPADTEWNTLTDFLAYPEGGKMKESGLSHWNQPNQDATNSSGFTALPGGQRYQWGGYQRLGTHGYFWSSTEQDGNYAWERCLESAHNRCLRGNSSKAYGYSVRCVRNSTGPAVE